VSRIGYKQLVAASEARIRTISAAEAMEKSGSDDVVFVDLRDVRELQREGGIPGAFHCPRGLLEFWIDPESPYHHSIFAEPKEFVFFCNLGWRSALAADIAQQMGLVTCHIDGGFEAWKALGGAVAERKRK
jgi:rhodanese-related sulfurtransferase